ncbi:uncharacterized protein [Hyperolius riggenbachi]|uniref:uncharacterized protein n=1 Tax=Hyperolius riggenbachi TaxID=752182 RepID=UPI0035A2F4EB
MAAQEEKTQGAELKPEAESSPSFEMDNHKPSSKLIRKLLPFNTARRYPQKMGTVLLAVTEDYTVKIGLPPRDKMDNFYARALVLGKVHNASHVVCSPDGDLYCIRGGDIYVGSPPSKEGMDWFSTATRVGKAEWDNVKLIFFHPNGDLYITYHDGTFYTGPAPENENISWRYGLATKVGVCDWYQFDALFFDAEGILYAVNYHDRIVKNQPPTEPSYWLRESTEVGRGGWCELTHFMSFDPDGKLWAVNKKNGNIYRGNPPTVQNQHYKDNADYLGWNYNVFRFLSFTKDKTIRSIISFQFLPELGQKVSETAEVIADEIYDNSKSTSTLKHTFTFTKTIKDSSSFTHEHGFTFEVGAETMFKAGVPFIAENETTVEINLSTTHKWSFTEANETQVSLSSSSPVEIGPGKAVRMVASVKRGVLDVPYRAKVNTIFGFETEIKGKWNGVSYYNMIVKQEDYTEYLDCFSSA